MYIQPQRQFCFNCGCISTAAGKCSHESRNSRLWSRTYRARETRFGSKVWRYTSVPNVHAVRLSICRNGTLTMLCRHFVCNRVLVLCGNPSVQQAVSVFPRSIQPPRDYVARKCRKRRDAPRFADLCRAFGCGLLPARWIWGGIYGLGESRWLDVLLCAVDVLCVHAVPGRYD